MYARLYVKMHTLSVITSHIDLPHYDGLASYCAECIYWHAHIIMDFGCRWETKIFEALEFGIWTVQTCKLAIDNAITKSVRWYTLSGYLQVRCGKHEVTAFLILYQVCDHIFSNTLLCTSFQCSYSWLFILTPKLLDSEWWIISWWTCPATITQSLLHYHH